MTKPLILSAVIFLVLLSVAAVLFFSKDKLLLKGVEKNNPDLIKTAALLGADINVLKKDNEPLLIYAVKNKLQGSAEALLAKGADVNILASDSRTPLFYAIEAQDADSARRLIKAGADIYKRDLQGQNPLEFALQEEQLEIVLALAAAGADIDAKDSLGNTLLQNAIINKKPTTVIETLIKAGADIETLNNNKETPLFTAVQAGEPAYIQLLIEAGAELNIFNNEGQTPLIAAATRKNKKEDIIKLLLDSGADASIKDRDRKAAWEYVPSVSYDTVGYTMRNIALEKGPDASIRDKKGRQLLSRYIIAKSHTGNIEETLWSYKADANDADSLGKTPLIYAVEYNYPEIIELLLDRGANIDIKDNSGLSAADYARKSEESEKFLALFEKAGYKSREILITSVSEGSAQQVALLVEKGVDINAVNPNGFTALTEAAFSGKTEMAEILIKSGADVNKADLNGTTPLMYAADKDPELVMLLLEAGANVNEQNAFGFTALHMAVDSGNVKNVRYLISYGASPDIKAVNGKTPGDMASSDEIRAALKQ